MSRINDDKPYELYEALFGKLLSRFQNTVPGHDFRFKNTLYSLDASTIDLCLSVFPWAEFKTTKGAVLTQIGIAMRVYLLLAYLKFQSKFHKSMQQILRILHLNLFEKRDLMALLKGDPEPDGSVETNQMTLV